jgi:hypothetical protein
VNWDAASAIAEAVGALTVVITLIYLTIQLRQNTLSQRAAVEQQISSGLSETFLVNADTDIPRIWVLAYSNFDELTDIETKKFGFFLFAYLKQFEHAYIQYEMGNVSEVSWKAIDRAFRETLMVSEGARQYWKLRGTAFHEGFGAYVESTALEDVSEKREAMENFLQNKSSESDT